MPDTKSCAKDSSWNIIGLNKIRKPQSLSLFLYYLDTPETEHASIIAEVLTPHLGNVCLFNPDDLYNTAPKVYLLPVSGNYRNKTSRNHFKQAMKFIRQNHCNLQPLAIHTEKEHSKIKLGGVIPFESLTALVKDSVLKRYLCARANAIHSGLEVDRYFQEFCMPDVIEKVNEKDLLLEIQELRKSRLLFRQGEFEVFLTKAEACKNIMIELGRMRELTFRQIGEGTQNAIDLDSFDLHYDHLILWSTESNQIAGAYRLGSGSEIMQRFGPKGFYIRTLFKTKKDFNRYFEEALELGRSFVSPEYQQKRLPLFLLWKGIQMYLNDHPEIKYIIGPVSISNRYSSVSRSLMVKFIRKYYFDNKLSAMVRPKKAFKPNFCGLDAPSLISNLMDDPKNMDSIIEDVEPLQLKMPVLIKKYLKQNARIIGFNTDPKFSDALDGFMIAESKGLKFS